MNRFEEEMNPDPALAGIWNSDSAGMGHGAGAMGRPPRRGILVSVKLLKKKGVNLDSRERERAPVLVGDLKVYRNHARDLEFQSTADLLQFDATPNSPNRFFPTRIACLVNPEFFAVDERGMIIYGIERQRSDSGELVSYWQTWQVIFGVAPPEPPPRFDR